MSALVHLNHKKNQDIRLVVACVFDKIVVYSSLEITQLDITNPKAVSTGFVHVGRSNSFKG